MAENRDTENFALGVIVTVLLFLLLRAEWSKIANALGFGGKAGAGGRSGFAGSGGASESGAGGAGGAGANGGGGCGCGGGCGSKKVVPFAPPISLGGQSYSGGSGYSNSVAG